MENRGDFGTRPDIKLADGVLDHGGSKRIIARRQGVLRGAQAQAVLLMPGRSAPVQLRHEIRSCFFQSCAQQFAEEMMVAIPLSFVVQRHDEQVGPLEFFQRCFSILLHDAIWTGALIHNCITQGTAHSLQDRGL